VLLSASREWHINGCIATEFRLWPGAAGWGFCGKMTATDPKAGIYNSPSRSRNLQLFSIGYRKEVLTLSKTTMVSRFGLVLRSSARDVALIVVGILIAFFLDAWWDDQVEQKELIGTLKAVNSDFLSTKRELDAVVAANEEYIAGITTLVSLRPENIATLDTASKARLRRLLPTGGLTFDPVMGSLIAFISSGQINRLRDVDLRSLIGAWSGLMDEIGEDQAILIDMYMAQQERSVELGIYMMNSANENFVNSVDVDGDVLRIVIQDEEMLNRLAAHRFAVQSLNDELIDVANHLDMILLALERQLNAANKNEPY
jgi:hypothetical protein